MLRLAMPLICVTLLRVTSCLENYEDSAVCRNVCQHKHHYDDTARAICGCIRTLSVQLNTDKDICDYLCSIQQGGAACDCSIPIVPGRRRRH